MKINHRLKETELRYVVEKVMLNKLLYIGDEVPTCFIKDSRGKFILLGSPQEFIDDLISLLHLSQDIGEVGKEVGRD